MNENSNKLWTVTKRGLCEAMPRMKAILQSVGCEDASRLTKYIERTLLEVLASSNTEIEAAKVGVQLHRELTKKGILCQLDEAFMLRNMQMALVVSSAINASHKRILDVQTGNGFVALMLSFMQTDCDFTLTDKYDKRRAICKHLPWENVPSGKFDTLLFLTILHHCPEPEKLFQKYVKDHLQPKGKIIIVENTFNEDDQIEQEINVFFDWLLNRCIHPSSYPCPNTHKSVTAWRKFLSSEDFVIERDEDLGWFSIIKVSHHLWVARKAW